MKKFKAFIVITVILTLFLSCFTACRPQSEEEWDTPTDGNTTVQTDAPSSTDSESKNGTEGDTANNTEQTDPDDKDSETQNKDPETQGKEPTTESGNESGNAEKSELNENPLMNEGKKTNFGATISYDIDKTGFSKGTIADLKGKTLTLYTGVDYSMFGYVNGEKKGSVWIGEWQWFKELKKVYGLTVKYVRCGPGNNVIKPFQAMSAGKDCDVITTHVASFPYVCNILAPLDQYADFSKFENSPGLDPQMTEATRWKGHPVALGPCLSNGALAYDKTYIASCGLDDPRELFEKGEWNWTNFKKYMLGLPKTTKDGKKVIGMSTWGQYYYWASSNGKPCFEIDGDDPNGGIINNWDSVEVRETYIWLESICDAGGQYYNGSAPGFFSEDKTYFSAMAYSNMNGYDIVDLKAEGVAYHEQDWVPFPRNEKNPNSFCHVEIYGYGIGLPRKTNKENARTAAMKFAEIWCNRYTESRFDRLRSRCLWTYDEIVEYYEYGKKYGKMGLGSGVGTFANHAGGANTNWAKSITDASFSTATCHEKASNYAKQEIQNVLKFGVQ